MPGPFDTTTRFLVQQYPADWIAYLRLGPPGPVRVVDANLSMVTAEVDKVIEVAAETPWLAHLEFQSSHDATMGARMLRYNSMLHLDDRAERQALRPVASVVVLLRPAADGPALRGEYDAALPGSGPYVRFAYAVRRVWQEPTDEILNGGLGTLPMAPLSDVTPPDLPAVLRAMDDRFSRESPPAEAATLRVVTYTLLGLRVPPARADQLMPGLRAMRDSSTYQAILEEGRVEGRVEGRSEGRVEEARELLIDIGSRRFGPPDARASATIAAIDDHARLHGLVTRSLDAPSWDELLAER
jgi:hypothetical protein